MGDIDSTDINGLRDTIFMGNEEAYYFAENLFVFSASAAIPISQAARAGNLTFRLGAATAAKEGISVAAGEGASRLTMELSGNRTASMVAGILASGAAGHGLNAVDTKFNISGNKGGSGFADAYEGVKQASEYLKQQRVPRQYRKQILESFDVGTIKLEIAGDSTYGLRFYGGNANTEGRYLFETFSPLTNRENLALPYDWNSMSGIQQFQVKSGTTMLTGVAAPQTSFGNQYIGGAKQWYINNLEDIIKCQ